MLNYAVITLALLGATICQAYNKDTLELLRAFGMRPIRHHDPHAWKYVETVGAGEGCCFPDKMEAQTSFILGSVQKGKPEIRQASIMQKHNNIKVCTYQCYVPEGVAKLSRGILRKV